MIQVQNLSKFFGPVCAVNNVSFQVEKDEVVGLLGNNGAGKTTLMRVLTTYIPASSGTAKVAGFDVMDDSMEVRQRVGYLPESIPLYPEMRVSEYLDYRAKLKGVERKRRTNRIAEVTEVCRIKEVQRRRCGTLSKGYRQRVGLADAMINDPPMLILDEPTDGLDPEQKQETLGLLKQLGKSHTIMLSSHMLTEVEAIVSRVVIMRRGNVGMAARLADLEVEPEIVVEVRGPLDQVSALLRSADGVEDVRSEPIDGELHLYVIRANKGRDLREALAARLAKNGHALRRLDLRRKRLQDRWNEINNMAESQLSAVPAGAVTHWGGGTSGS
jgi:ABC-2 type transport system ATP-binding protein